uniref:Uncharacterized protein n=1 Tax=Heterorhabditis bacteriophora TaxID=37862 RepID=A0A1I7W6U3_HETBA
MPQVPRISLTLSAKLSFFKVIQIARSFTILPCSVFFLVTQEIHDSLPGALDDICNPLHRVSLSETLPKVGIQSSQSFTAPTTPASSVSWKGGRSTFYQRQIGCEFSPLNVFPHQRTYSGDSTQELQTSMSKTCIDFSVSIYITFDLEYLLYFFANYSSIKWISGNHSVSRSATPQTNRLNELIDSQRRRNHQQQGSDASTCSSSSQHSGSGLPPAPISFHLARVGLDDDLQTIDAGANYKCIKVRLFFKYGCVVNFNCLSIYF